MKKLILAVLLLSSVNVFAKDSYRYCLDKSKQMLLLTYTEKDMSDARTRLVEVVQQADATRSYVVSCAGTWPPYENADEVDFVRVKNKNLFLPYDSMIKNPFSEKIIGSNLENETFLMYKFDLLDRKFRVVKSQELAEKNRLRIQRRIDNR